MSAFLLLHAHRHILEESSMFAACILCSPACGRDPPTCYWSLLAGTEASPSGPSELMPENHKKGHSRGGRGSALAGTGWSMVPTQNAWRRPQPASSERDDKAAEAGAEDRIDEWGIEALQSAEAAGGWDNPQSQDLDDEWPMPGCGDTTGSTAGASDSPWDVPPSADSHWDAPASKPVAPSKPVASNGGVPKALGSAFADGEEDHAMLNIFWLYSAAVAATGQLKSMETCSPAGSCDAITVVQSACNLPCGMLRQRGASMCCHCLTASCCKAVILTLFSSAFLFAVLQAAEARNRRPLQVRLAASSNECCLVCGPVGTASRSNRCAMCLVEVAAALQTTLRPL